MDSFYKPASALGALLMLFGCIGEEPINRNTAMFNLAVSDAAIDSVDSVVVVYSKVALLSLSGEQPIVMDIELLSEESGKVDLLKYQGSSKASLVTNKAIPPGEYELCLFVRNGESQNDQLSHVVETNTHSIEPLSIESNGACPLSGEESEYNVGESVLHFDKTLTLQSGDNHFVAEFDLRSGLQKHIEQEFTYTLQKESIKLIDERDAGVVMGTVDHSVIEQCRIDNLIASTIDAVYLYPTQVARSNMGSFSENGRYAVEPIAAANVTTYDGIHYEFDIGYVEEGTYSLGYTCVADKDPAVKTEQALPAFNIYQAEQPVKVYPQYLSEIDFSTII
ncbi:DUF4382 domain-containing protein [uncultured Vibrio sp.]|uniref:DUF4382 domain-containing protein n=1 Tax=uncultured Vibrio sp. TaxID=114054 RepID=UPI0025E20C8D|nr:DUF4382 domain-containing protein [uncultured Vibrio sp.]